MLLALSTLYVATASYYVLGEDNGEFCAIYATGGVAHPSGYPLYSLLLHAFSWLPTETPARGAALVTVTIGLAAVALLYLACRAWGANWAAAALASVVYGTAPLTWDLSTKAEVFALNAALAAAIVLVGAPEGPLRGAARASGVALLFGLGLSNHHSIVFLAPVGVFAMSAAWKETPRRGRAAALSVAAFVVGLSPYATLPWAARANPGWAWGDVTTAHGIVAHFLRRDFGTTQLAVGPAHPSLASNLGALTETLFVDLRGVGFVVGLGVFVVALGRLARPGSGAEPPRLAHRRGLASLAAAFLLAGPGFATLMNVELSPEGTAIVRRFHLLPLLLLCIPFALGAERVLVRVRARFQAAAVATALVAGTVLGFYVVREQHNPMIEHYVVDSLETAPANAVILGSGDVRVFGVLYAQLALGVRRDVVFVSPILLHYAWYRRRVEGALGFSLPPPIGSSVDTAALAERVLGNGRRLFLTDVFSAAIPASFPTYPLGVLIEVLPHGAAAPWPAELEQRNVALFEHYHVDQAVLDMGRAWSRGARDAYERPWVALAAAYRGAGDVTGAERSARRATTLSPWVGRRE